MHDMYVERCVSGRRHEVHRDDSRVQAVCEGSEEEHCAGWHDVFGECRGDRCGEDREHAEHDEAWKHAERGDQITMTVAMS